MESQELNAMVTENKDGTFTLTCRDCNAVIKSGMSRRALFYSHQLVEDHYASAHSA